MRTRGCAQIANDYDELYRRVQDVRHGRRLVCTIGSWDILHRGHVEYLKRASEVGDILIVGVDSDSAYERYKRKPVLYPQSDRQEIISVVRQVDYVTVVDDVTLSGEWQMDLVKKLQPEVFVCNERSYSTEQRNRLAALCEIRTLPFYEPAKMSSSAVVSDQIKSIVLIEKQSQLRMRVAAFWFVVGMLALSILTSLSMIVLDATGILRLRSNFVFSTLVLKSTPELFLLMNMVMKYLFPSTGQMTNRTARPSPRQGKPGA